MPPTPIYFPLYILNSFFLTHEKRKHLIFAFPLRMIQQIVTMRVSVNGSFSNLCKKNLKRLYDGTLLSFFPDLPGLED